MVIMQKSVLIISSSMRNKSNSEKLAEQFAKGAEEAGNKVEIVKLKGKKLAFCQGCLACSKTGHCVINDDGNEITEKMKQADVLVFATPIYYYELSGQMKTMLDRANPLYFVGYTFRNIYLLTAAADQDAGTPDRAVNGLEGWISCFEKARLAGTLFAGGVDAAGEIEGNPVLEKAYEMGRQV